MANWTKETVNRVEGEVIPPTPDQEQQTGGATTPAGNTIEAEKKEGVFSRFVVNPVKKCVHAVVHAPTAVKVGAAAVIGVAAGVAYSKFTGDNQEEDTIIPTLSLPVSVLNEEQTALADNVIVGIPEIPETDKDEIDEAVGRMSDAVEQIIAPVEAEMDVTE